MCWRLPPYAPKAHGSYHAISGGWVAEALFDLTGRPTETLWLQASHPCIPMYTSWLPVATSWLPVAAGKPPMGTHVHPWLPMATHVDPRAPIATACGYLWSPPLHL